MDEIVDVVSQSNKLIRRVTKAEAHKKGLLHRTVVAEVKDSSGRWALVRQAADKQDAGQYVSPVGGHVKAGESEEDALKRETLEEVGLKDFKYRLVGRVIYNRKILGRLENHLFILFEIFSDKALSLNEESVDYQIFTEEELKRKIKQRPAMFGDAFYFVLKNFYPELL